MSTYTVTPNPNVQPKAAAKGEGVRATLVKRALAEAIGQHSSPVVGDALAKHLFGRFDNDR